MLTQGGRSVKYSTFCGEPAAGPKVLAVVGNLRPGRGPNRRPGRAGRRRIARTAQWAAKSPQKSPRAQAAMLQICTHAEFRIGLSASLSCPLRAGVRRARAADVGPAHFGFAVEPVPCGAVAGVGEARGLAGRSALPAMGW